MTQMPPPEGQQQWPGNYGPPPAQQTPGWSAPHGAPAGGPAGQGGTVVIPAWASSDWLVALRIAGVGQLLLLLGGVVVALVLLLAQMASAGLDFIDWGSVAISPVLVSLSWAGAGSGEPILVTGILYTFLAYRMAARMATAEVAPLFSDRIRAFAAAGKVGVISAGLLLTVGVLLNSFAEDLVSRTFGPWVVSSLDLTSLVFLALFVGTATGLFALLSASGATLVGLLGLRTHTPAMLLHGVSGARRTVLFSGVGLLVLYTLGALLDELSRDGIGIGGSVGALLSTLASLLVSWLDTAVLLLLGATKFLHDGGYLWAPFGSVSGWMWMALPVVIGAYLAGGIQAAKAAQPRTQAEAAKAALLVGPGVALVGFVVAIGWAGQGFIEDIIPIAILLPTLWGVVALAGAWLWGNQQGLGTGLVVERANTYASPPAGYPAASGDPPASASPANPGPGGPAGPGGWGAPPHQPDGPFAPPMEEAPPPGGPQAAWPTPSAHQAPGAPQGEWGPPPAGQAPGAPQGEWGPPPAGQAPGGREADGEPAWEDDHTRPHAPLRQQHPGEEDQPGPEDAPPSSPGGPPTAPVDLGSLPPPDPGSKP
jgi:hypothetical protein